MKDKDWIKVGATAYYTNVMLLAVRCTIDAINETTVQVTNELGSLITVPISELQRTFEEAEKR